MACTRRKSWKKIAEAERALRLAAAELAAITGDRMWGTMWGSLLAESHTAATAKVRSGPVTAGCRRLRELKD